MVFVQWYLGEKRPFITDHKAVCDPRVAKVNACSFWRNIVKENTARIQMGTETRVGEAALNIF